MRPLKFRAWNKIRKEMSPSETLAQWIYLQPDWRISGIKNPYASADIVFMQYTGLKDKNGKDVYEGDILAPVNPPSPKNGNRICEYVGGSFCYNESKTRGDRGFWPLTTNKCKLFQVIGNIYENPELMSNEVH